MVRICTFGPVSFWRLRRFITDRSLKFLSENEIERVHWGMTDVPQLTHELVNDVPLLLHSQSVCDRLVLDQSLDAIWPRHRNWQGLSPGQVLVTWPTHVLSEGDHRMSQVQDWANTLPHTLSTLLGQPVRATRFA